MSRFYVVIVALLLLSQGMFSQKHIERGYRTILSSDARVFVGMLASDSLQGREAGEAGGRKAAGYIVSLLEEWGIAPLGDKGYLQPFVVKDCEMNNILAVIPGKSSEYVVVGAHYDHLGNKPGIGIHPGADDNASGIVALLSLAKMMKASGITPEYTVVFCAWDGEEKGLLGSKYFVADWYASRTAADSICRYMNFDMVGRCDDPSKPATTFAWNDNFPSLKQDCISVYETIEQPFTVIYDRRLGDGKGGSDYAPFSKHNVPFVAWMEEELHEDYHKPGDVPSKICWERLHKTVLLAYGILYSWVD